MIKNLKQINGHHIAKILMYLAFVMLFYVMITVIKDPSTPHNYPSIISDDVVTQTLDLWAYNMGTFIRTSSDITLWVVIIVLPLFMVWLMDISVGIGRSRYTERLEKKKNQKL